jgi:signal transduction histidine kinase
VRATLPGSPSYQRLLRGVGIGTWVFIGLPILDAATRRGYTLTPAQWGTWLASFWLFGPAFWYSSGSAARPPLARAAALLLEAVAVLGMTFVLQDYFVGFLLVIVSWQAALLLPFRVAVGSTLAASVLLLVFLEPHYYMGWRWGATGAFVGFQVFALVTAALAKGEAEAREDQARINAELVSTRELLRESSKLGERLRIARDLHDSVGHHLTALCLHLEAALHSPQEQAAAGLQRARDAASEALRDVRSVVSAMHGDDEIDLVGALRLLEDGLPRVHVHLSVPDALSITDPERANAVLRCVQEVATNTLKHSDAANLWIALRSHLGRIDIEARDDGRRLGTGESGVGLTAMRQRFEALGGAIAVDPGAERGFAVRAWLPARDDGR